MTRALNAKVTQEYLREHFSYDENTGLFTRIKVRSRGRGMVGDVLGRHVNKEGYCRIHMLYKMRFVHRLAWLYVHGTEPEYLDHINGNKLDNRFSNLRVVTKQVNQQNRHGPQANSKTGYLGVKPYRTKFSAIIKVNKKPIWLGLFETPEIAYEAYLSAKRVLHVGCTI